MCQIIVKPQYYSMPPDQHIVRSYNNNSDGFGLAYWGEGMEAVHIQKGAMTIKKVFQMIDAIPNPLDKVIVMHFRLATDGTVCPANCHPFPIASSITKLRTLDLDCKQVVAHNGVIIDLSTIRDYREEYGGAYYSKSQELSDTQEFILNYLVGCGKTIYNRGVQKLIKGFTDSKFVILTAGGRLDFIGDFIKDNGLYYSSYSYKWENLYKSPEEATKAKASYDYNSSLYDTRLRFDKKTGTWVNPKYYPDADFESTPLRYGYCESCKTWAKLIELEETWICDKCYAFYTARSGV